MSRSMSSKSICPKIFNIEKEDISFSVFTNTSRESFREYTMSLFIKQIIKRKNECDKIKKSFEQSAVFDHIYNLTMFIFNIISNEHRSLLEVIFDLMIKLQNIGANQIKFFCKDFFKHLIELVQTTQPQLNEEVSDRLFEYVYEILNHELFNSPEYLSVIEEILVKLIDVIINCESHSTDVFPLIHKIIEVYLRLNVS